MDGCGGHRHRACAFPEAGRDRSIALGLVSCVTYAGDLPSCRPISFVVVKIIIGVNLISYATRRHAGVEEREKADVINDFGRDPIGEGKEEQVCRIASVAFMTDRT